MTTDVSDSSFRAEVDRNVEIFLFFIIFCAEKNRFFVGKDLDNCPTLLPPKIWDTLQTTPLGFAYDRVSANTASSVPKTSKFQSGHRVVKIVLNN